MGARIAMHMNDLPSPFYELVLAPCVCVHWIVQFSARNSILSPKTHSRPLEICNKSTLGEIVHEF